jgi:hypothetical protein
MGYKLMQKVGRNEPCPCKSGKKYKKCCGKSFSMGQKQIKQIHAGANMSSLFSRVHGVKG